jgi:ABC-type sugar transport system, permease component
MAREKEKLPPKGGIGNRLFDFMVYFFLIIVVFLCLYPFWNIFIMSINDASDTVRGGLYLIPRKPTLESYVIVFRNSEIWRATWVSVSRTIIGTAFSLFFTTLLAYPMSKRDLFGGKVISVFLVFTMYFGGGLIPYYMALKSYGLIDSFWVYIIPGTIGVYNMILIRIYMESLPAELEESAFLDGAGQSKIFFQIVLPLIKPVMATIGLFTAVGQWGSWFDTNLYTYRASLKTLQFLLVQILNNYDMGGAKSSTQLLAQVARMTSVSSTSVRMATAMVATIPILIVYPFVQKYFVKGMMIGAVKG